MVQAANDQREMARQRAVTNQPWQHLYSPQQLQQMRTDLNAMDSSWPMEFSLGLTGRGTPTSPFVDSTIPGLAWGGFGNPYEPRELLHLVLRKVGVSAEVFPKQDEAKLAAFQARVACPPV